MPPPEVACWVCPNCGQMIFGENPPDMCDFCGDFTTWRPLAAIQIDSTANDTDTPPNDTPPYQLPLFD